MVWGQSSARGIDDLVQRIANNDPKLGSLTILRQRRFNHDDVASLVRAMASNTHLTELYASNHPLAPRTAALLADMLAASTTLRSLCVGDSSLGDEGVAALASGIARSSSLTHLDLGGKGLSVRGAQALATALATASSLFDLDLSANTQLADAGLSALCGFGGGAAADPSASSGSAGGAGSTGDPAGGDQVNLGAAEGTPAAPAALPAALVWAAVRVLKLQGCGITAEGVRVLAASPCCGRLEVLRLDGNPLGPGGGEALRGLMQSATQLRELHLRETELGDEGGAALASALTPPAGAGAEGPAGAAGRGSLVHLEVAECGLGLETLAAFRSAFAAGAHLDVLSLAGNREVRDVDVAALADSLAARGTEALAHLDLSGTQAGPLALEALSKAPGLRHLSVVGCPLGSAGAAALASSLSGNSGSGGGDDGGSSSGGWAALTELCVSGCGLAVADVTRLADALAGGGAPSLKSMEVGANPATQDDDFPGLLDTLRAARPGIAVYWRSGDDPVPVVR